MTYARFHLLFNLPPLAALLLLNLPEGWAGGEDLPAMGWVLLAVLVFTTPWDNLAAKWGIWGFPRDKYRWRLGHLPVEEYLFFVLQSVNVMLAARALLHFVPAWQSGDETRPTLLTYICLGVSAAAWGVIGLQLAWLGRKAGPRFNYARHLAWFLPVVYLQWIFAPWLFFHHAALLVAVTALFGVYYTVADLAAVRGGTWFFDEKQIAGWKLAGLLPGEEIAFFFLTSLLVAQSYLLLLPADRR